MNVFNVFSTELSKDKIILRVFSDVCACSLNVNELREIASNDEGENVNEIELAFSSFDFNAKMSSLWSSLSDTFDESTVKSSNFVVSRKDAFESKLTSTFPLNEIVFAIAADDEKDDRE